MPRSENKATPKVESGYLYTDEVGCAVDSPAWFAWLKHEDNTTFYYESPLGTFSARKEPRRRKGNPGNYYWYAYRHQGRKMYKAYLGMAGQLTAARLVEVARQLAERVQS